MIKLIGIRRLALIVILGAVTALFAAINYNYLVPRAEELRRSAQTLRGQVNTTINETQTMREEYESVHDQVRLFDTLKAIGFFADQDRHEVRRRLEALHGYAGVLDVQYEIRPVRVERSEVLSNAGRVMLRTPMRLSVDAMDDQDIYRFLYMLTTSFPGHMVLENMDVRRVADVNEVTLRQIGSGSALTLVRANMNMLWHTIVPEDQMSGILQNSEAGM